MDKIIHIFFYFYFLVNAVSGFQRNLSPIGLTLIDNPSISNSVKPKGHPCISNRYGRTLNPIPPIKSSEHSLDVVDIDSSKSGTVRTIVRKSFGIVSTKWLPKISTSRSFVREVLRKSWWIYPMVLALVPLYCAVAKGTCATMPEWWQVVKMDHILRSKNAALVVGCFLFSNISYFLAGAYLLSRFPFQRNVKGSLKPTRYSMLGISILIAGLVSTIFHSVQALGSYAVAESLCYIDHGVAISSGFFYFDTCGWPSRLTLALGIVGLAALVFAYPGYPFLHSSWHFLSAAAATSWAVDGETRTRL